jgi:hypothetical protein
MLSDVRLAAAGRRCRRAGMSSAVRRAVPVRTFNDLGDPAPGFVEVDLVAHGGTSVSGSFVQTVLLTDIATGWTECVPILPREGAMVIKAITKAKALFPFPLRRADFDNDSAFMNEVVIGWCREGSRDVTRARAYRKNDQAWVEQKNGAIVRRLVGYGRCAGAVAALCRRPVAHQSVPAIVQAESDGPGRRPGRQALPRAGGATYPGVVPSGGRGSGQRSVEDPTGQQRSCPAAGRDPRGATRAQLNVGDGSGAAPDWQCEMTAFTECLRLGRGTIGPILFKVRLA